jgi:hypothetical protein
VIALGPETIRLIVYEKNALSPAVRQLRHQFGQLKGAGHHIERVFLDSAVEKFIRCPLT